MCQVCEEVTSSGYETSAVSKNTEEVADHSVECEATVVSTVMGRVAKAINGIIVHMTGHKYLIYVYSVFEGSYIPKT